MGWADRLGRWSFRCGAAAGLAALGFALAARWDWIDKLSGFYGVALALLLAAIGLVCGLAALRRLNRFGVMGLVLCGGLLAVVLGQVLPHRGAPPIHDATTDLASPPEYRALELPPDNLRGVGSAARWRALHAAAYPNLVPIRVRTSPAATIDSAARLAKARGWTIVSADRGAGRLEAIAYESLIGFEDLFVLVARPAPSGQGAVVAMRSASRVGIGDLGANARRLRAFSRDLIATAKRSASPRPS